MFQGYSNETFEFFMAIRFNNNRPFFQENREWYYRAVREPSYALAQALSDLMEEIDPDIDRRPHRVVSRINRDIRFARDKSPYRDHVWLSFHRIDEEKGKLPGFYFELSDEGGFGGMGFYRGNRPLMDALRARILVRPDEALAIYRPIADAFALHAEINARIAIPDQVPAELRALYACRSFYLEKTISDFDLIRSPRLAEALKADFRLLMPLYQYIINLHEQIQK